MLKLLMAGWTSNNELACSFVNMGSLRRGTKAGGFRERKGVRGETRENDARLIGGLGAGSVHDRVDTGISMQSSKRSEWDTAAL